MVEWVAVILVRWRKAGGDGDFEALRGEALLQSIYPILLVADNS